jgi:hypothetical protein
MADIPAGQQVRITAPLTVSRIGRVDYEVEYPAGALNRKLYIPKEICEAVLVTQVFCAPEGIYDGDKLISTPIEYKCDICFKVCKSRIGLAGHKRSHLPKKGKGR